FIVVKFLSTSEDNNIYYEVALTKWLVQIDDNMIGKLLWPKNNSIAGKLVRSEANADETWQQFEVEVKRYHETYCAARNTAKGFEKFSSAYESESGCQMGRGKRKRRLFNPCYYLKSLPLGNDETRAVSKLMSHLISNSLAEKFNFDGHGEKFAFKSTKLWELVQG
ncbi:hypothetical protein ALC57_05393, partial [Trachymyrmex cornetzi]